jgi:hypothetical protein
MNNRTIKSDRINTSSIMHASLFMILLSLLISLGIELLMKELFRLG